MYFLVLSDKAFPQKHLQNINTACQENVPLVKPKITKLKNLFVGF